MTKAQSLRADFEKAVSRLDEALALPKDPIVRDSAIQRFEISFELCWKYLKAYLEEEHNASCTSPRTRGPAVLYGIWVVSASSGISIKTNEGPVA